MLTSIDLGTPGFLWLVFHGISIGTSKVEGALALLVEQSGSPLFGPPVSVGLSAGLSGRSRQFLFGGVSRLSHTERKKSCELRDRCGVCGSSCVHISSSRPAELQYSCQEANKRPDVFLGRKVIVIP